MMDMEQAIAQVEEEIAQLSGPYVSGDLSKAAAMVDSAIGSVDKTLAQFNASVLELSQAARRLSTSGRCS